MTDAEIDILFDHFERRSSTHTLDEYLSATEVVRLTYIYEKWELIKNSGLISHNERKTIEQAQRRVLEQIENAKEKERIAMISRPARKRNMGLDLDE